MQCPGLRGEVHPGHQAPEEEAPGQAQRHQQRQATEKPAEGTAPPPQAEGRLETGEEQDAGYSPSTTRRPCPAGSSARREGRYMDSTAAGGTPYSPAETTRTR